MAPDKRAECEAEGQGPSESAAWLTAFALLVAMIGASMWGAAVIPAHARVPVHFDLHGKADGFGGKWLALLLLPAVAACALLALHALGRRVGSSQRAIAATAAASTFVHATIHLLLVLGAAGHPVDVGLGAVLAEAMLMMVVGNYLPTTRRNGLIGIRTPWTLRSDAVWRRTHLLGGRLFLALGVLILCAAPISSTAARIVLLVGLAILVVVLSIYSYRLSRGERDGAV